MSRAIQPVVGLHVTPCYLEVKWLVDRDGHSIRSSHAIPTRSQQQRSLWWHLRNLTSFQICSLLSYIPRLNKEAKSSTFVSLQCHFSLSLYTLYIQTSVCIFSRIYYSDLAVFSGAKIWWR